MRITLVSLWFNKIIDRRLTLTEIHVYCKSDYMALISGDDLLGEGYRNIHYLDGGMRAWVNVGCSLEFNK